MNLDDFEENKTKVHEIEDNKIDIYLKQRNGRKCMIIVEGLGNDKQMLKSISKALRKKMSCSGAVCKNDEDEYYLKFSGKNVETIVEYLEKLNYNREDIKLHGV